MDKIKGLITGHQGKLKYLLLAGAGLAAFNTLARPDFNLIVYLYIYYVWHNMNDSKETQSSEKINIFFILSYSLLIDLIWCFFWGSRWGVKNDNEALIHSLVIFFSWVGIFLKVFLLNLILVCGHPIYRGNRVEQYQISPACQTAGKIKFRKLC